MWLKSGQYIETCFSCSHISLHQSLVLVPLTVCYFVVCLGCARFIAVALRGQPFLTYVSRCIYLAGLVNVIIMCPLCTVECLARRPSRLLKPSSTVNGLLQPAWGNSAPGGRGSERDAIMVNFYRWCYIKCSFLLLPFKPRPCAMVLTTAFECNDEAQGSSSPHQCTWRFALCDVCLCVFAHVHLCDMCI